MTTKHGRSAPSADPLAGFPAKLRHSTTNPHVVYVRASGLFAVRGAAPRSAGAAPVLTLDVDGDAIHVYRGTAPAAPAAQQRAAQRVDRLLAVYARDASGDALAVPTGRIFVRFSETHRAESHADELSALGYRIVQTISYAPNAAWLESTAGPSAALNNIDKIESLADVVNVEPQLIAPKSAR